MGGIAYVPKHEYEAMKAEIERLRAGLDAAIRAANLALFVIRKQGVMPNSSWESGFETDMRTAKAALSDEQAAPEYNPERKFYRDEDKR